jgi:thiamine transporter ThiT
LDPQAAILAFFYAAITKGIAIGAIGGFLRGLVQLTLGEKKTFGALEIFLTPCTAFGTTFYARHLGFSLI